MQSDPASLLAPVEHDADISRLAVLPGIQRFPSRDLTLLIKHDFLNAEEWAGLIDRIEHDRRPSTIADANGEEYFRTSETCDLSRDDPFVAINAKIDAFAGIDEPHGEPLQGQAMM